MKYDYAWVRFGWHCRKCGECIYNDKEAKKHKHKGAFMVYTPIIHKTVTKKQVKKMIKERGRF